MSKISEITIITPPIMIYISRIFQENFHEKNIKCNIVSYNNIKLANYNKILLQNPTHFYFIYCLHLLPDIENLPNQRYIIYQLEQHTNNKINHHYNKIQNILPNVYENAFKIFDYSLENINVLHKYIGVKPNILKVPFSLKNNSIEKYQNTKKEYDIVFIGAINTRRKTILNYLQKYFSIGISSKFILGQELIDFVCKGRILLNIHYYDNAILERVRLNEIIPIGIPIVSEKPNTRDTSIISLYKDTVHFIDIIQENNIRETLSDEINSHFKEINIEKMKRIERDFENEFEKYFNK